VSPEIAFKESPIYFPDSLYEEVLSETQTVFEHKKRGLLETCTCAALPYYVVAFICTTGPSAYSYTQVPVLK
jgi:hypothetical protein